MSAMPGPERWNGTLVTGGSGLLGLNWGLACRARGRVVLGMHRRAITLPGCESTSVDLREARAFRDCIRRVRPALVLHAAGLADVERCESEPARAFEDNVSAAERVAEACWHEGARLVHVSTDHLFDGRRSMVCESEAPSPVNAYGRTKAEAEARVLAACPSALVVRTNFFGWGPPWRRSFSDFVLDACRKGDPVRAWVDVHHTPISVPALALAVDGLLQAGASGIVHVVGDERISKYDLAMMLVRHFGLDASLIRAARAVEVPGRVDRPLDMSLSNNLLRSIIGRGIGGAAAMVSDLGAAPPSDIEALR